MAEAWGRQIKPDWVFLSAGSHPAEAVNPMAVRVMRECGIDLSKHFPKSLESVSGEYDVIVAVCSHAAESCPVPPAGARLIRMPFNDPAEAIGTEEERLRVFRKSRDEIENSIHELVWRLSE